LGSLFVRYRFNYIIFRCMFVGTNTNQYGAFGVLDDFTGEGDAPTTVGGVLEMRCSKLLYAANTTPDEIQWKPPARDWLYTFSGASGSDQRLVAPAVAYVTSTGTATFNVEVLYSITFKGAIDVGAN
jgi:hypothetical protein